jgi:hypothetical protein
MAVRDWSRMWGELLKVKNRQTTGLQGGANTTTTMTVTEIRCASLPDPETYAHLSLLDGGSFIGDLSRVHAGVGDIRYRMYNWAFYVSHKGRHILWDLGLTAVRTSLC